MGQVVRRDFNGRWLAGRSRVLGICNFIQFFAIATVTLPRLSNAGSRALEDTAAITKALEGATSLFAMTTPFGGGTDAETRRGVAAADSAKAAGVHLVFTSVGSANRKTSVPHFDSKYEVE